MLALYVVQPVALQRLDLRIYDALLPLRHLSQPSAVPVVIDIDEESLARYGQWPWPRSVFAELLGRLGELGAAVVACDILFAESDRYSPPIYAQGLEGRDPKLAAALKALPDNDVLMAGAMAIGWALMMAAARRITESEHFLRAGKWKKWSYDSFVGPDIHGATLGIIGMGRIGQAIARRAALGFGMRVLYHNRSRLDVGLEMALQAQWVDKATLLAQADHVLLVVPYSAQTHHLIGAAELGTGDEITGLLSVGGNTDAAALMVLCQNALHVLYGNSSADWKLDPLSKISGAQADSAQDIGGVVALDTPGVMRYPYTRNFGNFAWDTVSMDIQPIAKNQQCACSVYVSGKFKYRLFFTDGTAISGLPVGKGQFEWSVINYARNIVIAEHAEIAGIARTFYADDSGWVYEADKGRSLAGDPMPYALKLLLCLLGFRAGAAQIGPTKFDHLTTGFELVGARRAAERLFARTHGQQHAGGGGHAHAGVHRAHHFGAQQRPRRRLHVVAERLAEPGGAAHGVDPDVFPIAPIEAANKALARAGKTWADVDLVELNEAFASQSLACLAGWPDLDPEKLNVHGGALAIGHPLGASGGRIIGRAAHELARRGSGVAVVAICIGVGQGLAVVLER